MYSIKVNDIVLDFDGDIALTLNNPMFSADISYSLQFTVKNSTTNRKAFGYINRPDIYENKSRELPCEIIANAMRFTGTIVVKYQGGNFVCYFKVTGDFWSAIKDKYLSDIPFDVVTFDPEITYDDIQDVMDAYNTDNNDQPFAFPLIINKKIDSEFPVRVAFSELLNSLTDIATKQCSIVPYLYIHYIFRNIFEKNALPIKSNAFESNKFLKRLVAASNYLINEFALDTTILETKSFMITSIENSTDPIIKTALPHNLVNYQVIKLSGYYGGNLESRNIGGLHLPGYFTEAANIIGYFDGIDKIKNRIYQIELIYNDDPDNPGQQIKDEYSFKILGDDFSAFELYERVFKDQITISHIGGSPGDNYIRVDVDDTSDLVTWQCYYVRCNERTCLMRILGIYEDEYYILAQTNLESTLGLVWTNPSFYEMKYPNSEDGSIYVLPSLLSNTFKSINPANHTPYLKINEFLDTFKDLGIISFIRQTGVDIKLFKDIINSPEFDDISDITTEIRDIENPDISGYNLKFTIDGNDEYIKEKLPVQLLDPKYTVKNSVASMSNLTAIGSETNDVRLVLNENSYYVFNKSFLNADNNWKFLCYNLIDFTFGAGEYKIQTKASPAIPGTLNSNRYDEIDVPCANFNFSAETKMALRLLSFYNLTGVPYAASDIYGPDGNEIMASEMAIRWEGSKGLIEKLLKEKIQWETEVRKDMKAIVLWKNSDLTDFDFSRKKRVRGIDYLVKSIKFTLSFKYGMVKHNETELARV